MKKMAKRLEDLTIKEFDEYKKLFNDEDFNIFTIMRFLGYEDPENMELKEFNVVKDQIINQNMIIPNIQKEYNINGRLFHPVLEIKDIHAAQFTNLQAYMINMQYKEVLSVFLLPIDVEIKRTGLFRRKKEIKTIHKYGEGYDVLEVQDFLYNNFKFSEAQALASFFLNLTYRLLPVFQNSLIKQVVKQKVSLMRMMKKMKKQDKKLH